MERQTGASHDMLFHVFPSWWSWKFTFWLSCFFVPRIDLDGFDLQRFGLGLKCAFSFLNVHLCWFSYSFMFFFPLWFSLFLFSNWPLLVCHFIVLQPSNKTSKNLGKWEKQKKQKEKWNSKTKKQNESGKENQNENSFNFQYLASPVFSDAM